MRALIDRATGSAGKPPEDVVVSCCCKEGKLCHARLLVKHCYALAPGLGVRPLLHRSIVESLVGKEVWAAQVAPAISPRLRSAFAMLRVRTLSADSHARGAGHAESAYVTVCKSFVADQTAIADIINSEPWGWAAARAQTPSA